MKWVRVLMLIPAVSGAVMAQSPSVVQRDRNYEQALRWEASADKAMTPARFLRWTRSLFGNGPQTTHESDLEFRPVVKASETYGKRFLATIAYKF
jgi:hypothetical protein